MTKDNLQKLNNYFERYIDNMLINDIELLKARNDELKFSYPYILLVCSCIDLFGGIEKDFPEPDKRGNSEKRFKWFITEWMGKVNSLYKEKSLAYLIYDSWRCGIVHQATLKKGFMASSHKYDRDKHLHYIENEDIIYIYPIQFADDFIKAQKLYRGKINNSLADTDYIESLYNHLLNMMEENNDRKNQSLAEFIKILKNNNLVFNSTDNTVKTTTTVTSSKSPSKETFTHLPNEGELSAVPSAAPKEDDLK
ncbi:MAG: hypothetical protein ACD_26C00145G0001 [uncultured bacterium]|nr:MAG: hypothetical protein ACD_26C00145G0001 [uncultured bacterium]